MPSLCDPRLSYQNCPEDWIYSLTAFYWGLSIWFFTTFIGVFCHMLISFSRRGISAGPFENVSVLLSLAVASLLSHAWAMGFRNGDWRTDWWVELIWDLPLSMIMFAWGAMFFFFIMLGRLSVQKMMNMKEMTKRVFAYASLAWIPFPLCSVGSAILIHFRPDSGIYTYLLSRGPFLLYFIICIIGGYANSKALKYVMGNSPKKTKTQVKFGGFFVSLLALIVLVRIILYDVVLKQRTPAGWMVLTALEMVALCASATAYSLMIFKSSFTEKGIQALRGDTVIIKIDENKRTSVAVEQGPAMSMLSRREESRALSTDGSHSHDHDGCDSHDETQNKKQSKPHAHGPGESCNSHAEDGKEEGEEVERCPCGICIPMKVAKEYAEEVANPYWQKWPKSWKDVFKYPHPVNDIESRFQCFVMCAFAIAINLVHACTNGHVRPWWLYIYPLQAFVVRFLTGPRFQIDAWFCCKVFIPLFNLEPRYLPGPPKQQAQTDGIVFFGVSFIVYLCGYTAPAFWVMGVFLAFTGNQLITGICPGCFKWHVLSVTGIMPKKMAQESLTAFQVQRVKTEDKN